MCLSSHHLYWWCLLSVVLPSILRPVSLRRLQAVVAVGTAMSTEHPPFLLRLLLFLTRSLLTEATHSRDAGGRPPWDTVPHPPGVWTAAPGRPALYACALVGRTTGPPHALQRPRPTPTPQAAPPPLLSTGHAPRPGHRPYLANGSAPRGARQCQWARRPTRPPVQRVRRTRGRVSQAEAKPPSLPDHWPGGSMCCK